MAWPASQTAASPELRDPFWTEDRTPSGTANEPGILQAELERILTVLEFPT